MHFINSEKFVSENFPEVV